MVAPLYSNLVACGSGPSCGQCDARSDLIGARNGTIWHRDWVAGWIFGWSWRQHCQLAFGDGGTSQPGRLRDGDGQPWTACNSVHPAMAPSSFTYEGGCSAVGRRANAL